jgi:hypothetical protein
MKLEVFLPFYTPGQLAFSRLHEQHISEQGTKQNILTKEIRNKTRIKLNTDKFKDLTSPHIITMTK